MRRAMWSERRERARAERKRVRIWRGRERERIFGARMRVCGVPKSRCRCSSEAAAECCLPLVAFPTRFPVRTQAGTAATAHLITAHDARRPARLLATSVAFAAAVRAPPHAQPPEWPRPLAVAVVRTMVAMAVVVGGGVAAAAIPSGRPRPDVLFYAASVFFPAHVNCVHAHTTFSFRYGERRKTCCAPHRRRRLVTRIRFTDEDDGTAAPVPGGRCVRVCAIAVWSRRKRRSRAPPPAKTTPGPGTPAAAVASAAANRRGR